MRALTVAISVVLTIDLTAQETPVSYEVFDLMVANSPNDSRSAEWRPGDGIALEVSGMEWIDDTLAVAIRKGEVWMIDNALSDEREEIRYRLFASGLHEPLGLLREGNDLLVLSEPRLRVCGMMMEMVSPTRISRSVMAGA